MLLVPPKEGLHFSAVRAAEYGLSATAEIRLTNRSLTKEFKTILLIDECGQRSS